MSRLQTTLADSSLMKSLKWSGGHFSDLRQQSSSQCPSWLMLAMNESTKEPKKLGRTSLLLHLAARERLAAIETYPIEIYRSPAKRNISNKYRFSFNWVQIIILMNTHGCRSPFQQQIRGKDVVILLSS